MVYIGLVSTINGFEQTIKLRIKVNLFCGHRLSICPREEETFMQNLFLRLSKNIIMTCEISQQDYGYHSINVYQNII